MGLWDLPFEPESETHHLGGKILTWKDKAPAIDEVNIYIPYLKIDKGEATNYLLEEVHEYFRQKTDTDPHWVESQDMIRLILSKNMYRLKLERPVISRFAGELAGIMNNNQDKLPINVIITRDDDDLGTYHVRKDN